MPSQILTDVTTSVTNAKGAMESATVLINGFGAKLQAAIDAALANGATAEELAPLSALATSLDTDTTALAAAVAANP